MSKINLYLSTTTDCSVFFSPSRRMGESGLDYFVRTVKAFEVWMSSALTIEVHQELKSDPDPDPDLDPNPGPG